MCSRCWGRFWAAAHNLKRRIMLAEANNPADDNLQVATLIIIMKVIEWYSIILVHDVHANTTILYLRSWKGCGPRIRITSCQQLWKSPVPVPCEAVSKDLGVFSVRVKFLQEVCQVFQGYSGNPRQCKDELIGSWVFARPAFAHCQAVFPMVAGEILRRPFFMKG